jgi:hypothetical protein
MTSSKHGSVTVHRLVCMSCRNVCSEEAATATTDERPDCLLCLADRDAGRVECKACGKVFETATDPADPGYYFGPVATRGRAASPLVNPPKSRGRALFSRFKP